MADDEIEVVDGHYVAETPGHSFDTHCGRVAV
jgi:hypothetical protein